MQRWKLIFMITHNCIIQLLANSKNNRYLWCKRYFNLFLKFKANFSFQTCGHWLITTTTRELVFFWEKPLKLDWISCLSFKGWSVNSFSFLLVIETNSACPISVSFCTGTTAQNEWIAISLRKEIANEKNTDNENGPL